MGRARYTLNDVFKVIEAKDYYEYATYKGYDPFCKKGSYLVYAFDNDDKSRPLFVSGALCSIKEIINAYVKGLFNNYLPIYNGMIYTYLRTHYDNEDWDYKKVPDSNRHDKLPAYVIKHPKDDLHKLYVLRNSKNIEKALDTLYEPFETFTYHPGRAHRFNPMCYNIECALLYSGTLDDYDMVYDDQEDEMRIYTYMCW